jgi:phosphotransferase system  glucose/maltose/N-acetylglucosamine-specific IIC component
MSSTNNQCKEVWKTVSSQSVWQPLGFVYIYTVLQVNNAAWTRQYLRTVLDFTSTQLNVLLNASFILLFMGIVADKYLFIISNWRIVYIVTTIMNLAFSLFQVSSFMESRSA